MSNLLAQFEHDCAAHGVQPLDVLKAADIHTSLWWKWKREGTEVRPDGTVKPRAVSPTLRTYEALRAALDKMVAEKAAKPAKKAASARQSAA